MAEFPAPEPSAEPEPAHFVAPPPPPQIEAWVAPDARAYAAQHKTRLTHTIEMTPAGDASKSVLEMGAYMQITASLKFHLGYGVVRGCYYGELGRTDHKAIVSESGETFECDIDHFDAERDVFPLP